MVDTIFVPAANDIGNILVGCASVTPSSEDALFPKAYLTDGEIGPLFKYAAAAANDSVIFDLDRLDGSFEDFGASDAVPPGWTDVSIGTGAIARETSVVDSGSVAVKLIGGGSSNNAVIGRQMRVQAGWAMTVALAIRGDGTNPVEIYIRNRETGGYLKGDETWTTTPTVYATRSTASYGASGTPAAFSIEASSVGLRGVYTFDIWVTTIGTGYVDSFYIWPHWDFAAVFNHNLGANMTARVRSDDNVAMSSATNRVAFTLRRPAMFGVPAATVTERFAEFYDDGTNPAAGEKGELLLAQKLTSPRSLDLPLAMTPDVGIIGAASRPNSLRVDESVAFDIGIRMTQTNFDNLRAQLLEASRWGGRRMVVVPDSSRGEVYYGTFLPSGIERLRVGDVYQLSGRFTEMGYAIRAT